jgi:CRISPR-associated protein Cas1
VKSAENLPDFNVIYVTTQGTQVAVDGGRIIVRDIDDEDVEKIGSFPVEKVDTVNVFGGVNFTTPFISTASEKGIVLNYFSSYGNYKGSFVPEKNTISQVRRKQYDLDNEGELSITKEIVRAKIKNSKVFLGRKGVRETAGLDNIIHHLDAAKNQGELRGYEGEAAELYFEKLDQTLKNGWTFEKRSRRPPEDHINSLLSLTYVMMKNELLSALRQYNLDPFLGIFHDDRYGRPALALDLLEELRPIFCDALATRLVNRQTLTHDSFKKDNRLRKDAFDKYLEKFESFMTEEFTHPHFEYRVTRRKAIRLQAILLRKVIVGEMEAYHPLVFQR